VFGWKFCVTAGQFNATKDCQAKHSKSIKEAFAGKS